MKYLNFEIKYVFLTKVKKADPWTVSEDFLSHRNTS